MDPIFLFLFLFLFIYFVYLFAEYFIAQFWQSRIIYLKYYSTLQFQIYGSILVDGLQ
jgi:hypothetical protein